MKHMVPYIYIYLFIYLYIYISNIIINMGEDMSSFTELEGAKHTYHTVHIYIYPTGLHSATLSLIWVKILAVLLNLKVQNIHIIIKRTFLK
jgi:hypothetical protein